MPAEIVDARDADNTLRSWRRRLLVTLLAVGLALTALPAKGAELSALRDLTSRGGSVSALVVDLVDGRRLAELGPDRALIPASVVKLFTAALALETWGPEHRFVTELRRRGAPAGDTPAGDTLAGDLVLIGGGDPTLTDDQLWRLAEDLRRLGLRRVAGDLVIDRGRFGAVACASADRCDARRYSRNSYDAPLSAAGVNYSNAALLVAPGPTPGSPARLALDPAALPSLRIQGEVLTTAAPGRLRLERVTEQGINWLKVDGTIKAGRSPARLYRSIAGPSRHTGELFRALLARAGVDVAGGLRVEDAVATDDPLLLSHEGRPLGEAIDLMMAYSNNVIADTLALNLLRELRPDLPPPIALVDAGGLLNDYAGEVVIQHESGRSIGTQLAPTSPPGPRLLDGSGLNPDNRLAARDLIALLDRLYRRSGDFPAFLGSLVVPAHGLGRAIRADDADWMTRLASKSGGLSEPVTVVSLAGYLRLPDDGWGAFAVIVNGPPGEAWPRADLFAAIRSDFAAFWRRP